MVPIGMFDFLKITKAVFYKLVYMGGGNQYGPNRQDRWRRTVQKTMMVWKPNELHEFLKELMNVKKTTAND